MEKVTTAVAFRTNEATYGETEPGADSTTSNASMRHISRTPPIPLTPTPHTETCLTRLAQVDSLCAAFPEFVMNHAGRCTSRISALSTVSGVIRCIQSSSLSASAALPEEGAAENSPTRVRVWLSLASFFHSSATLSHTVVRVSPVFSCLSTASTFIGPQSAVTIQPRLPVPHNLIP